MKKIIFAFLICCTTAAFAQKINFSGSWQLDTNKTAFGEAPKNIIPWNLTVAQQADKLVLTRVLLNEQLQALPPKVETLALDGTPFQQTAGDTQIVTTIHWLDDASLMLTRNGTISATETWTLEEDGKTLFIDRSVEQKSNGFKYNIKCYYTRQ